MSEPWASYEGDLGQTSVWLAADGRPAEREARRQERERQERLAERAENREMALRAAGQQWAHALGQPWDPMNPFQHIPSPAVQAEMLEAAESAQLRRQAKQALRDAGLPVSMLKDADLPSPATVPVLADPQPSAEEQADAQAHAELVAARHRTERARTVARMRRIILRGKGPR